MIKLHCDNHRVELAVNEAIARTEFSEVDDIYHSTFLLKNSVKIKSKLSLLHTSWIFNTTDFQRWQVLVVFWSLESRIKMSVRYLTCYEIIAFENVITDSKTRQETTAKVQGLLKKLNSCYFVSWNMFIFGKGGHTPFSRSTPPPF